ncbi:hypothetical protein acsn021_06620 [Anaerocolumna cellulosilytica]|uniref:Uncharacterized protein n=1 Tax=Anaerocolumna cellulosilytica TaxID=433286 RepID=A0A6S6QP17_9FIRM|nr:hypothetical protein [Anaerocolumna cellulosilytica]MBB5197683.1 hypothetical protein [Anaerocolumna cellulosilytica]BCJ93093.1 hypothetical protein acsn021_06620 [Anaerocolumna cellulosilytica]
MKKTIIEMLDLALLTVVISIILINGLSVLYQCNRQAINASITIADKNTNKKNGFGITEYGNYDNTLNKYEIALIGYMKSKEENKSYQLTIKEKDVNSMYEIWNLIGEDADAARYSIKYKYRTKKYNIIKEAYEPN